MPRYGIAVAGKHKGEMTLCRAHDSSTCPYHVHDSHAVLTKQQAERFNESVIASEQCTRTNINSMHRQHSDDGNAGRLGLRESMLKAKGGFMDRKPMGGSVKQRMKKAAASAIVITSIMGMASCGGGDYNVNDYQQSSSTTQSTENQSVPDDGRFTGEDAERMVMDGYTKAKDKWEQFKGTDTYKNGKQKLKKAVGDVQDYVQSGDAASDLQSMIDSLSNYWVGGSAGDVNSVNGSNAYGQISKEQALQELSSLRIEQGDESGYDRGQWRHWIATSDAPGGSSLGRKACFDVREQVLARQGEQVRLVDNGCEVQASLTDPYTGTGGHDRRDMQIDHAVPLGYAYAHGGRDWSAKKKQDYANDLSQGHLIAALASENTAKSDKGPSQWLPDKDQCGYAKNFTNVLYRWDLSTTSADHDMMQNIIRSCAV